MASADVTRRELSLGARDETTNWPSKTYAETTIKGSFDPADAQKVALAVGMPLSGLPFMRRPFYTGNLVARGDHITHSILGEVSLEMVKPIVYLNQFIMYACDTEKILKPADRAATSGTWHTDSESVKTDPRNRIKEWIDAHISYGICDYEVVFAGGDYPFEREFISLGNEIICAVDVEQSTPEYTYDHYPYKFNETCTITNTAIDTATLTATNILESFEQAIRDVATDHPLGSIRRIQSSKPSRINIGGAWLWQNIITIEYSRANDDYVPSYPTITWGAPSGTFIFPNVTHISPPLKADDAWLKPPGFSGTLNQALGSGPIDIEITCDLDMEHSDLTWRRPQTAAVKTDGSNFDIFLDLMHNEGISQAYHTLTLETNKAAASTMSLKVRLVSMTPNLSGEGNKVTLLFREYMTSSASSQTIAQRFGITA